MMDDSSDDGLPDLEELPALDKASTADFEVRLLIVFYARLTVTFKLIFYYLESECPIKNRKSKTDF